MIVHSNNVMSLCILIIINIVGHLSLCSIGQLILQLILDIFMNILDKKCDFRNQKRLIHRNDLLALHLHYYNNNF